MSGRSPRGVLSGTRVLQGALLCLSTLGCRATPPEAELGPVLRLDCGVELMYGARGSSLVRAIGTNGVQLFGPTTDEEASPRTSWFQGTEDGLSACTVSRLRTVPGAKGGEGVAYDLVDGAGVLFARVRESAFCLPGDPGGERVLGVVRRFEVTSLRTGPTELFVDVLGARRALPREGTITSGPPQWDEGVLRQFGRSVSGVFSGEGGEGELMLLWSRPPCLVDLGEDPAGYLEVTLGEKPIRWDVASVWLPEGSCEGEVEIHGILD